MKESRKEKGRIEVLERQKERTQGKEDREEKTLEERKNEKNNLRK